MEKKKEVEKMCYGLLLVNFVDDDKRLDSVSFGVFSVGSEKLDEVIAEYKSIIYKSVSVG